MREIASCETGKITGTFNDLNQMNIVWSHKLFNHLLTHCLRLSSIPQQKEEAMIASDPKVSAMKGKDALGNIVKLAALLSEKTQSTYNREDRVLVPAVAAVVSESEQKSFNSKVIRKLGILDSRIHLVGMYDAVWEDAPLSERDEFEKAIPYIPRKMIPRWRRNLYEPQAGMLNV